MSRILLASDLDRTLLDNRAEVPGRCLDAIRAYVERGGLFTVATGRPTRGVLIYPELTSLVNAPAITYNGACIYDVKNRRTLWRQLLPEDIGRLIRSALERFPTVGALVFRGEDDFTCAVRENRYTKEISWTRERYQAPLCALEDVPLPWNKVVMTGPPGDIARCVEMVRREAGDAITTIFSEEKFLEITGPGVGKGKALERVAQTLGLSQTQVVAMGDSMNDLDMISWAGTGVAVQNAEMAVLQAARAVVASNEACGLCECMERIVLPLMEQRAERRGAGT